MNRITRRTFLGGAGALAAAALGAGRSQVSLASLSSPVSSDAAALAALGRSVMRYPGSRPFPDLPAGTDTLPQIEHIVVLMMENHSYDNVFGVLPAARSNGTADGFTLGAPVTPWNPKGVLASNPYGDGRQQLAFHMPTTCQKLGQPTQEWTASHEQYDNRAMDGFVTGTTFGSSTPAGPITMGYWDETDLPFTYSLARQFPIGDRWFCSVLGQTDPNRRFLIAATSSGMTDDITTSPTNPDGLEMDALLAVPTTGTIFTLLSSFGISWADYTASYPTGTTSELYPVNDAALTQLNEKPVSQFFTDCAAGSLPAFSLVDPDYSTQSQENPQDMVVGEAVIAQVVQAVGSSPLWDSTLLVIMYDEHGGYYDHVPPCEALAPDLIQPVVAPGQSCYDGFHRYGIRVPSVVISPYAVPGGVTHVVHDHASILATVERKWNLPALNYRDANANDVTDFLDMDRLAAGRPTFPALPALAFPGISNCPNPLPAMPPAGSVVQ